MKISYILQLKDFSIMFLIGILIGMVYGILNIFSTIKKTIVLQIISDLIFSFAFYTTLLAIINIINMGEFRIFLVVGYLLGYTVERITLGKLFAKLIKKMYNLTIKGFKRFSSSKIGRIVLK